MNPILFGLLAGTVFGTLTVLSMLPMEFADVPIIVIGALGGTLIGWLAGRYAGKPDT